MYRKGCYIGGLRYTGRLLYRGAYLREKLLSEGLVMEGVYLGMYVCMYRGMCLGM